MARQHVSSTSKKDSKFTVSGKKKVEWQGYVTFEISEAQKKAMAKAKESGNDPIDWLPRIAAEGVYEVKCKWDSYNDCWCANLYCSKPGHKNAGWSLPARAGDFWEALRRVSFIHIEVLAEEWGVDKPKIGWTDDQW